MKRKPKKVPSKRVEHVVQFPLMDNCILNLQVNQISGSRWSIGFPKDEVVYPIPIETAQTLLQAYGSRIPGGCTRRVLTTEEFEFLAEYTQKQANCNSVEQDVAKANVDRFVSDMGKVWEAKQPQIMDIVRKLNDMITVCELPIMEAIFSLAITALMGAATIGASGPHVASLVMRIAEHIKMHVQQAQVVTDAVN